MVTFARRQPGWLTRAAAWALVVAFTALAVVLIVPVLLIALVVFAVLAVVGWARFKLAGARSPDSPMGGRRNVRVITRADP